MLSGLVDRLRYSSPVVKVALVLCTSVALIVGGMNFAGVGVRDIMGLLVQDTGVDDFRPEPTVSSDPDDDVPVEQTPGLTLGGRALEYSPRVLEVLPEKRDDTLSVEQMEAQGTPYREILARFDLRTQDTKAAVDPKDDLLTIMNFMHERGRKILTDVPDKKREDILTMLRQVQDKAPEYDLYWAGTPLLKLKPENLRLVPVIDMTLRSKTSTRQCGIGVGLHQNFIWLDYIYCVN
jgi:hypothetical protein